jgi:GntR family transcriptional regulator
MEKLTIKRTNIPLYVQMEQILKSEITTGKLMPGDRIPTEKELAEIYNVSAITARQAILNLVQEGLLVRQQGKGTFVRRQESPATMKNIMTFSARGDVNNIIPETLKSPRVEVLDMSRIGLNKKLKEVLNIQDENEIIEIRRIRSDNDLVFSYIRNYLPIEIGERIKKEDLLSYSMLHILVNKLKIPITSGVQYITAVVADYETASALSVNISSPLLYLETTYYDKKKRPVEFVQTFYRSDQFKYTLTFGLKEMGMD